MDDLEETSDSTEWPTWKCAALTGALCGVLLLLPFLKYPIAVLAVWVTLLLIYLGLVKFFGSGFVIEGAIIVLVLSILFLALSPRFIGRYDVQEVPSEEIKGEILPIHVWVANSRHNRAQCAYEALPRRLSDVRYPAMAGRARMDS